jgi:hypothetical protein
MCSHGTLRRLRLAISVSRALRHRYPKLTRARLQAHATLKPLMPGLLPDEGDAAAVRRALAPLFARLRVPFAAEAGAAPAPPASPPPRERVQQDLNSVTFLKGLGHVIELCTPIIPDALGEALVAHLATWLRPADVTAALPNPAGPDKPPLRPCLPASWRPGDELRAVAAALALFQHLPDSSLELLQTRQGGEAAAPDGQHRRGLVVLCIELEQACTGTSCMCSCCHKSRELLHEIPCCKQHKWTLWSILARQPFAYTWFLIQVLGDTVCTIVSSSS